MSSILEINGLDLVIQHKHRSTLVLSGIHLSIQSGEIHGLVGESGAGKSMLAKAIIGILPGSTSVTGGSIRFGGTELIGLGRKERRLMSGQISMIPQDPMTSLNPVRRVGKQMCDVLHLHLGLNRQEAEEKSLRLLEDVQIRNPHRVMRQYPFELSGGMRQRVLIAMAFSCNPQLIIADEPTTALDVTVQRQILQLIKRLQADSETALLFISHDLGVIAKICDVVSVMYDGGVVEWQKIENLFEGPQHPYTCKLLETTSEYYRYDKRMFDRLSQIDPTESAKVFDHGL